MSWGEEQQKEIETIRERKITVKWAVQGWSTQERTQQRLWTLLAVSCM